MTPEQLDGDLSKKERKKQKKAREAETRAWLEAKVQQASTAPRPRPPEATPIQEWLHALSSDRLIAATKASFMVAMNGVMLVIAAHALYAEPELSPLLPLALTNLLSLVFSVAAVRQVKEGEYEQPPAGLDQSREELLASLTHELHLRADALAKSRRRLRTAYTVLLGGVLLAAVTFVLGLALGG